MILSGLPSAWRRAMRRLLLSLLCLLAVKAPATVIAPALTGLGARP